MNKAQLIESIAASAKLTKAEAKRALEVAAAGGHNIIMVGSPGSGKTMLARALPGILPPLNEAESLEVTKIYSITGNLPESEAIVRDNAKHFSERTVMCLNTRIISSISANGLPTGSKWKYLK